MILFNQINKIITLNKFFIIICLLLIIFSCKTNEIHKSFSFIKTIEDYPNDNSYSSTIYQKYRHIRESVIDSLVKKKKLKNFLLYDSFEFDDGSITHTNTGALITTDSVYNFYYQTNGYSEKKKIYVTKYQKDKIQNIKCFYINFKRDSLIINSKPYADIDICKHNMYPVTSYFSNYKNGKLDKIAYIKIQKGRTDSILYQKKNSKMVLNLK